MSQIHLVQCLKLNSTYSYPTAYVIFLTFAILLSIHGTFTFHDHYVIPVMMLILISTHFSHSLLLFPSPCYLLDNPIRPSLNSPLVCLPTAHFVYNNGQISLVNNIIMKFSGNWVDLESMILREITQTQKEKPGCSPVYVAPSL